jgi:phytoene synthase
VSAPAIEIEQAYRRCEQITRHEAANFYYGIRLLPSAKRHAMSAVYAFARRVDDIGDDGNMDREAQLAALATEREMVASLAAGVAHDEDPVAVALAHARGRYGLPIDALQMLIDGVQLDVLGTEYETFDELVGYCRHVAGSVGRLCLAIFADGAVAHANGNGNGSSPAALADDLGVAMQLTNILRDVREDHDRGRLYLPAEDLRRFGCTDVLAEAGQGGAEVIRYEAARATQWFDRGLQLTAVLDRRSASCVLAMTGIYRSILDRIAREPSEALRRRVSLAPWEKAWVAARSLATVRPTGGTA